MNWIDIGIIALVLYHAAAGLRHGLARSMLELIGLVAVLIIAVTQFTRVAGVVQDAISLPSPVARWLSFFTCLGVSMFALKGVVGLLSRFVRRRRRSWPDRVAGVCIGGVRGLVLSSMLLVLLTSMPIPGFFAASIEQSPLAPSALAVVPLVYDTFAPRLLPRTRPFHEQLNRQLAAPSSSRTEVTELTATSGRFFHFLKHLFGESGRPQR